MLSLQDLRGLGFPRRCFPVLLLALIPVVSQLPFTDQALAATLLAPIPERTPWTHEYQVRQSRLQEADLKARLVAREFARDAEKKFTATPNMDLYDVHFYDLFLELDTTGLNLTGVVTMAAEVTGASIATLDLHLRGLTVSQTMAGGVPVSFTHIGEIVTITLDRTYLMGEQVSVEVAYLGNPAGNYFGWSSYGGQPMVWTLSEPFGAREWWPCKDLNTDKADSVDIAVTVPDHLVVASNGLLVAETVPAAGKKTYSWQERYPIATYLVSLAVHPYALIQDVYHSAMGDTMPLDYYVVPDQVAAATAGYAIVPDMLSAFAGGFGEYPFVEEKYGHAHFPWGGGMEHQTMTSLGYGLYNEWLIAHELGHQWFGDYVTCADFHHIWLNEGFATWSEAYWREINEGTAAYHAEMADARYLGPGTIFVEDTGNVWAIFDYDLTYRKASWIPHMLRRVLGEADFFTALNQYLDLYGHGSATTEQFQAVFEGVSGLDLTAFFQQWIYGDYYPIYDFSWNAAPSGPGYQVTVRVEQVQVMGGLFAMPLDVVVTTTGGAETFVINQTDQVQWHSFQVDDPVNDVALDPDHWVLRSVNDNGVSDVVRVPAAAHLAGNVPNPFNPATEIRFTLPTEQAVRLSVYDVSGRLVKTLVDGMRSAGDNAVDWDGTDASGRGMASGTYFARLTGSGINQVKPMALIR